MSAPSFIARRSSGDDARRDDWQSWGGGMWHRKLVGTGQRTKAARRHGNGQIRIESGAYEDDTLFRT